MNRRLRHRGRGCHLQVTRLQLPIADLGIMARLKGAARQADGPNVIQEYRAGGGGGDGSGSLANYILSL